MACRPERSEGPWAAPGPSVDPPGPSLRSGRPGAVAGIAGLLALLALCVAALAADLPALSGRIVDQANLLPAAEREALDTQLADLETKSGIQLVVATVNSLGGQEIEPYANTLFRAWKLGEKAKDNGVLLLVAPNERRVRIEVGYGLEGTLTDALSKVIIANAITPRFKAVDFVGGITLGVDDIVTVLTTDASEWQKRPSLRVDSEPADGPVNWLVVAGIVLFIGLMMVSPTFRWMVLAMMMSGRSGGGGGFGGGGGGFDGGGSSGSW